MLTAPRFLLLLWLGLGSASLTRAATSVDPGDGASGAPGVQKTATLKPVSATTPDIPYYEFDVSAEQQLLDLANQSRAKAGAPPLKLDAGLSTAARTHAEAMVAAGQLSHQFNGEPALSIRVASATSLILEQAGENVALDYDAEGAHQHLMLSPPHRENLLNPAFDVVGLGVVTVGDRLYIVQDFGRAILKLSMGQIKDRVATAVAGLRQQAGQPELPRQDLSVADNAACSMAQADKLGTPAVQQLARRYSVLSFTSLHPETLPSSANPAVSRHDLRSFSVGACFSRTSTYPSGAYWVVLSLE